MWPRKSARRLVAQRTTLYPACIADVFRVGFGAHTDTLLLLGVVAWELVSLRRSGSEWLEVQRVQTDLKAFAPCTHTIAVCDSRVLLGG